MTVWICATCGVEHADTPQPPAETCVICADDRQWVPPDGQHWTTAEKLAAEGARLVYEDLGGEIHRFNREPSYAIGQWTHLVRTAGGNLLWDPPNHVDPAAVELVRSLGGVAVIVASHPHMYGSQVAWSHAFDNAPILVHSKDRDWVRRSDPVIREWSDTVEVLPGVTVTEVGGHFPGMAVAHVATDGGTLLSGDAIVPVAARGWATFLRSYPNRIPLSPGLVRRIVERATAFEFDRLYGLAGGVLPTDAVAAVRRSAERYIAWVSGANDHLG